MLSGDNGILQKATTAKDNTEKSQIEERLKLAYHSALTTGQGSYTNERLDEELEKEFGNDYAIDDSDDTNWILSAKGQSITIPAGKKVPETDYYSELSIGDYVNYPIEYENVTTYSNNIANEQYTGWRILSKEGSGKNAYIRLVSAGVPLNYLSHDSEWNKNSENSVENLTTKFFETQIDSNNSNGFVFYKCGFKDSSGTKITSISNLKTLFATGDAGKYTAISNNSFPKVQSLTKYDIDKIWGSTLSNETVTSNDLIAIPARYGTSDIILATAKDENDMWAVAYYGFIGDEGNGAEGIRTVVTLKPKIKFTLATSKINNTNTWNLSE